jgi:hypothetical protein
MLSVVLPASCLVASLGSCTLFMQSCVGVAMIDVATFGVVAKGVATLCVDLRASCLVPSLYSCALYVESFVSVSTSVCEYRVPWRLDAPLGLIWN